jgi:hypothetical protein
MQQQRRALRGGDLRKEAAGYICGEQNPRARPTREAAPSGAGKSLSTTHLACGLSSTPPRVHPWRRTGAGLGTCRHAAVRRPRSDGRSMAPHGRRRARALKRRRFGRCAPCGSAHGGRPSRATAPSFAGSCPARSAPPLEGRRTFPWREGFDPGSGILSALPRALRKGSPRALHERRGLVSGAHTPHTKQKTWPRP